MSDAGNALSAALADRYRVERELGAGGMATVYLAQDLRHDRQVAIKVLHEDLGATLGPERFLAEIKTTAKLQHPHILPLLDSGNAGGLLFYVMPYVEGETLRSRLTRETQLPIEDAVRIAREVADALGFAHGHGIVHRDIKPENILLQGGHALVADFGIALAVQQAGGTRLTQTGLSLGTPQYMSPEQAMGDRTVDHRSDLYALGAVTYEMLTGDPPFTGSSVQAIVAKVLSSEPERLTTTRRTIPPNVEAAVLTALAKLPADRFGAASEFARALAREERRTAPGEPAELTRRWNSRAILLGLAGMTLLVVGWLARGALTSSSDLRRTIRFSIHAPPGGTIVTTNMQAIALSRDGTRLAYTTNRGLEIRALDSFTSRVIEAPATSMPFFSPDGLWLGYSSGSEIWKVPVNGGSPVRVAPEWAYYATWGDDGRIYFTPDNGSSGIAVMNADGSGRRIITTLDSARGEAFHQSPEYLPSGILLYSAAGPTGGWGQTSLMAIVPEPSAVPRIVLDGASSPRYVAPDQLVYIDATGRVVTRAFDPRSASVSGDAIVLDSVRTTHWGAVAQIAASREGTVAYVPGSERGKQVVSERDAAGRRSRVVHVGNQFRPSLSPDGSVLTVADFNGRDGQIVAVDLVTLDARRVTLVDAINEGTVWPATSRWFIYGRSTSRGGREFVMHRTDSATSDSVLVSARAGQTMPEALSPDGRWLAFSGIERGINSLYLADLQAAAPPRLMAARIDPAADISRDGRWLAYCVLEAEGPRLYMVSLPQLGQRTQVTTGNACVPRFSPDGLSLYFVDRADWVLRMGMLHEVRRSSAAATTWSAPRALFPAFGHHFAVGQNPTRFYLVEPDSAKLAREIRVAIGWRP